jgi:hypothetical protein
VEGDEFVPVLDLGKAAVLEKRSAGRSLPEWAFEPYIARKTREHEARPDPFALT